MTTISIGEWFGVGRARVAADENSPLLATKSGSESGTAASSTPSLRSRSSFAIVGALALASLGFAYAKYGDSSSANALLSRKYIVTPYRMLGPEVDQCSAACRKHNNSAIGEYAFEDEKCKVNGGGIGCYGPSCRLCQTKPYASRPTQWRYQQCPPCVCNHHGATGCDPCPGKYSYFRFNVHTIRQNTPGDALFGTTCSGSMICQFSEVKLYTNKGTEVLALDPEQSTVLNGNLCASNEGPNAATDGSLSTKMCDRDTVGQAGGLNFVFAAVTPSQFSHYEFFTANDCPVRDPTSWTFYGSTESNQGPWIELSSSSQQPPEERFASYGKRAVCG